MSNKKGKSMIHVPFSWEKIPGVPKFIVYPEVHPKFDLPYPPARSFHKPATSVTKSMFLWEEDPFLAALLECTKDYDNSYNKGKDEEIKKRFGSRFRMSKPFLMSCKHSIDVDEGHLLTRPSSLGSILRRE